MRRNLCADSAIDTGRRCCLRVASSGLRLAQALGGKRSMVQRDLDQPLSIPCPAPAVIRSLLLGLARDGNISD